MFCPQNLHFVNKIVNFRLNILNILLQAHQLLFCVHNLWFVPNTAEIMLKCMYRHVGVEQTLRPEDDIEPNVLSLPFATLNNAGFV